MIRNYDSASCATISYTVFSAVLGDQMTELHAIICVDFPHVTSHVIR